MANKYLEKIADFDFDAHNSMVNAANKANPYPAQSGGWKGDMNSFASRSNRATAQAVKPMGSRPMKLTSGGIVKRILTKFK